MFKRVALALLSTDRKGGIAVDAHCYMKLFALVVVCCQKTALLLLPYFHEMKTALSEILLNGIKS